MLTRSLHARFGVEICDFQLADIRVDSGYREIRDLFERHSLLLFRQQFFNESQHLAFGELFGPVEDRSQGANGPGPVVSRVSNLYANEAVIDENHHHLQHLKANQLWHTDSTFLPVPALANILVARVLPASGGETDFVSTRVAWQDLPLVLKKKVRARVFCHRYAHSRAKISAQLAQDALFTRWSDQRWSSLWQNPLNGEDALYIASHIFAVEGLSEEQGLALIDTLVAFATQPQYQYRHHWQAGDVLLWDERATMHRGRPWLYNEVRCLDSICISAGDSDGLDLLRPG